jgi:hypothetical protein
MFESVQGVSGPNNRPDLTDFKQLYVASSSTKKAWKGALQIMIVDKNFFERSHL